MLLTQTLRGGLLAGILITSVIAFGGIGSAEIASSDVTLNNSAPPPGSEVNVTVTATPDSTFGTVITQSFNQTVAFASGLTVQVGGSTVAPQELSAHSINRSGITVAIPNDEVSEDEQIKVTYTITTANTTGKTVEITGEATNLSPTELPERVYRITSGDDDGDDGRESDSVSRLTFEYSDFGGSINLEINDDRRVESTLSALDEATVGGATVEVPQASTRSEGLVVITGEIDSISVGGQEFNLDNVTFEREGNPVATVEFDSLTPTQSRYEVGDEFTSSPSGVSMSVEPFIFSDGDTFRDGSGSRRDSDDPVFAPTNVNLRFNLSSLSTGTGSETPESPTGVITGNIRTIDDNPVQDVAQLEIQLLRGGTAVAAVQADPNGEYSAEVPVASGSGGSSYTVEVDSPRFEPFSRQLTVFAGATERLDIRLQESSSTSTSAIDATRSLTSTEVTNGSTVTVTVSANFESSIDDAKVVDTISGGGGTISAENLTITQSAGAALPAVTSDPQPAVDITWNSQLGGPLDSDSVTVEYELTIPEDTPVGTTITFDGTVTNVETDGTAGIDGDSSVEVVATTSPDTVTVGGQEVPTEFTSTTASGDPTVTADNAVEAINTFIAGDVSADVAVNVINAFIAS